MKIKLLKSKLIQIIKINNHKNRKYKSFYVLIPFSSNSVVSSKIRPSEAKSQNSLLSIKNIILLRLNCLDLKKTEFNNKTITLGESGNRCLKNYYFEIKSQNQKIYSPSSSLSSDFGLG